MPASDLVSDNDVQQTSIATINEIAQWMYDEFQREGRLSQSYAAQKILELIGEEHLYRNGNHNWAINKSILNRFKQLRGNEAVWARQLQIWRRREPTDPPDSLMVRY